MCFWKSKQSKVLRAKRDIIVYKIGDFADDTSFNPFFHRDFKYPVNQTVFEKVEFTDMINLGLHSYIMCELVPFAGDAILYSCKKLTNCIPSRSYLGEFIIPKGATYCLNNNGEVVSNRLIYTGNHTKITVNKTYNSKDLWKEKQVKYLLVMENFIRQ